MDFWDLLEKKRPEVLALWRERFFAEYPADSSGFLTRQKDPFANPVGTRLAEGLAGILRAAFNPGDLKAEEAAIAFLDDMAHIRAVQDFTPARAVRFLFDLKDVCREVLAKDLAKLGEGSDWHALDRRIDALALTGFDFYGRCREKIFDIRVNEVRNLSYKAMQRANLVAAIPELDGSPAASGEAPPDGPKG